MNFWVCVYKLHDFPSFVTRDIAGGQIQVHMLAKHVITIASCKDFVHLGEIRW